MEFFSWIEIPTRENYVLTFPERSREDRETGERPS